MGKIMDYIKATKYNIGFVDGSLESVIVGEPIKVKWLKHSYKDRWFADPFILDVTEKEIIVLVEEWYDPIKRGRISKLVVDKSSYELKHLKVMIDEGSHLSFPAISMKENGLYIQPESSADNNLVEYKYNKESDSFERKAVISDLPLTDSARTTLFGNDLLFSTKLPDANGKELGIYYWDKIDNKYKLKQYYHFEDNISRMAGNFFVYNNMIYRPAQVCIKSYGDAVSLQEVKYHDGTWSFREIRRLYSPSSKFDLGFHTFNVNKGVIVIDALGYRHYKLSFILRRLKRLWKK